VFSVIKIAPRPWPRNLFAFLSLGLLVCFGAIAGAQTPSSSSNAEPQSSSSTSKPAEETPDVPKPVPRIAQPEAGGAAITLETSEPLFDLAVALNTCGYDTDLASSSPVRLKIREEVNAALTSSADARDHRDALCGYIRTHTLSDPALNIAQYISLALYLNPAPQLSPSVGETELPPDSTQVVNILPLLRTFSDDVNLHALWVEHRPEYEAVVSKVHDPLTKMILDTNIYLRLPVSSYDGRRFLVLLEPMLAPLATNARIYANDYIVVASPSADASVHMDQIRHTYLHYEIEPLVYAKGAAMQRLQPLLKAVQDAPLDFTYKSDVAAFLTECLIKAVEAQTMDVGLAKPKRPDQVRQRSDMAQYEAEVAEYDRQAEAVRRRNVNLAVRQGWVLVDYFYGKLGQMEKDGVSLREDVGEMVYGMDVDREKHAAEQVAFLPEGTHDLVRRVPRQATGMELAELKLIKGDLDGAAALAKASLNDPKADHAEAHYVLARVNLMQRQPEDAINDFEETLKTSKDPRTLAWSHIYLGRLYDVLPDRDKAIAEYRAALTVRDGRPDTKAAAEKGLKEPFAAPKTEHSEPDDDAPLDPSGKAEKDAYRPAQPR
jgi:tetratricopeptide (TPR) repeat protein